jgi:hypothetical protein
MPYNASQPYGPSQSLHGGVSGNITEDFRDKTLFCHKSRIVLAYRKISGKILLSVSVDGVQRWLCLVTILGERPRMVA